MSLASTYPPFNLDAVRHLAAQDHQSYRTITPPDARVLLASVDGELAAANARADAAERDRDEWRAMHKRANEHRLEALTGRRLMKAERDQLAARLTAAGTSLHDTRNFDDMSAALNAALTRVTELEDELQEAHWAAMGEDL